MEQHGNTFVPLTDLDDLRPLAGGLGPFLSVHMRLGPATEELADELALRWRAGRSRVASEGAPEPLLAVVDDAVEGAQRSGDGLSVVAGAGGDVLVSHPPVPPPVELVRWEAVPSLVPLIAVRQRLQPHVVALVDRVGADLAARHGLGADTADETVEGADHPIRKAAPGGWSQRRYQQRAEETWHHNMGEVATGLTKLVEQSGARLVAVGGDERAVGLVLDQLPAAIRGLVRPIAVTRAADGSTVHLDDEVDGVVGAWVEDQLAQTREVYDRELGQHDRATAGADDTLAALREARVAVLLVGFDAGDDRRAWVGAEPSQVATTQEALASAVPGDDPASGSPAPLVDSAVAAALATGADVRVLPESLPLPEGLGAVLRW